MGHRALVAFERRDHLYDLRYSHWGGDDLGLTGQIDDESPLGNGAVESSLLADSIAFDRVLVDYLDPSVHEALFIVSEGYEVDPYRVLWLEWSNEHAETRGAVIPVEPGTHDCDLLTWFRAVKGVLGDVIEMGSLTRRAAVSYLEARVCEDRAGQPYTYAADATTGTVAPAETAWYPDDRTE
jgi:hypothetical protein